MDGKPLAGALVALVGTLVCGAVSGVGPAWATAEHAPAPAPNPPPAALASAASELVWPSVDGAVPTALLVPVAHAPAALVAPSYAVWLTAPPHSAAPDGKFTARGQVVAEIEVFQKVIVVPPPAPEVAKMALAAAPLPVAVAAAAVPLPPKRLAEPPRMVLASLAPLPPKRLVGPFPVVPQEAELVEDAPSPSDNAVPQASAAQEDAPQEDAAKPIDDAPEPAATRATAERAPPHIEALIERHAERFDVPTWLVRRVAWRESKFDPSRRNGPYWGLMQIRVDTARALGFRGTPKDLLDANTNMTYAVAYLANAYRVAGRDETRAVMLYAKGYYYEAKRKRMLDSLIRTAAAEQ
jgi:soluble lytic murein transglycosylase-like protein